MTTSSNARRPLPFCHRHSLGWGLLLGCLWPTPLAFAQQPLTPPSVAPIKATTVEAPHDVLSGDARLDAKVTLTRRDINVDDALRVLTRMTHIELAAGGNEIPASKIILAVKDESLRGILRSLAELYDGHWKRMKTSEGRDVLTLMDISDDPRYYDFLRPKTQEEADLHLGIEAFQKEFARLSPDAQKAFAPTGPGVAYATLTPAMQRGVRQAFAAYLQGMIARHGNPLMTEDDVQNMKVTLQSRHPDASTFYTVKLTGPWVPEGDGASFQSGATLDARVPDDPNALNETVQAADFVPWQSNEWPAQYARYAAAHTQAVQSDARLNHLLSIKSDDASAGYPLAALAEAAQVNIVSAMLPETHTVSLTAVPLKDALDQITAKYRGAWTEAADGTIVVYRRPPTAQDVQTMAAEQAERDAEKLRAENVGR